MATLTGVAAAAWLDEPRALITAVDILEERERARKARR